MCAMVIGGLVRPHREDGEIFARVIFLWNSSVRHLPAQSLARRLEENPVLFDGKDVAVVTVGVVAPVVGGDAPVVAFTAVPSVIANDTR